MLVRFSRLRGITLIAGLIAGSAQADQDTLTCQVRCSDTKLRTGIAELTWFSQAGASPAAGQPALDVTVFHRGFERGLYQSFGKVGERSTPQPVAEPGMAEKRMLRAYDLKLRVTEKSAAGLTPAAGTLQKFEIENVEPGLLYRFRLRNDSAGIREVSCEAPICPADMKEVK